MSTIPSITPRSMASDKFDLSRVHSRMDPVLSGKAQRTMDQLTIERFGLPAHTLMENAGRGAARAIAEFFGPLESKRVVICCGRGNNGGDGFVIARVLCTFGASVQVLSLGAPSSTESALNLRLLEALENNGISGQTKLAIASEPVSELPNCDLYIDALFGTGLSREIEGPAARWIAQMNSTNAPIAAIDIPSGLHADSGKILGQAVRARLTTTMGTLKPGLLLGSGPEHAGAIRVIDIGIPDYLIDDLALSGLSWRTTDPGVAAWLPARPIDTHKYSAGMVLIVGGSRGFYGAPVMAAEAAARIGAGYVACAVPEEIQTVIAEKLTEIPTIGLPTSDGGEIRVDAALAVLKPWLAKARALLVGPGLGRHPSTQDFVREFLAQAGNVPTVVDADGLNALSHDHIAGGSGGNWILTPHLGEFRHLTSSDAEIADRLATAQEWAQRLNCTLILKGMPSVVGTQSGSSFICGTGNPALATAGTGDVLAGLVAGLLAQGSPAQAAAVCALHVGGAAADRYAARNPKVSMVATDMLCEVPLALQEILACSS